MINIELNLIEYYSKPEYFFRYLDLRFKYGSLRRRDILNKANVYQSAFSKAKQNNYMNSTLIIRKFEEFYRLDRVNYSMLIELERDVCSLITGVYYMNTELQEESYRRIKEKEQWFSTTYIAVIFKLFDLMYEVSRTDDLDLKSHLFKKYKEVEEYYDLLVPSLQLLFMYVGFTVRDHTVMSINRDISKMEKMLVNYPSLRGCGLYRVASGFRKIESYNASIQYYLESLEHVLDDVNVNRIVRIEKQLFDLYREIGTLQKAHEIGKKLLLGIADKMDFESYKSICFELSLLCIQLGYYDEALDYCKNLDFKNVGEYRAIYMLICYMLSNYEDIESIYNHEYEFDDVYSQVMELIYDKTRKIKSKRELKIKYSEIYGHIKGNTNCSISKYIEQLK